MGCVSDFAGDKLSPAAMKYLVSMFHISNNQGEVYVAPCTPNIHVLILDFISLLKEKQTFTIFLIFRLIQKENETGYILGE